MFTRVSRGGTFVLRTTLSCRFTQPLASSMISDEDKKDIAVAYLRHAESSSRIPVCTNLRTGRQAAKWFAGDRRSGTALHCHT
jgi:hypothetical protein